MATESGGTRGARRGPAGQRRGARRGRAGTRSRAGSRSRRRRTPAPSAGATTSSVRKPARRATLAEVRAVVAHADVCAAAPAVPVARRGPARDRRARAPVGRRCRLEGHDEACSLARRPRRRRPAARGAPSSSALGVASPAGRARAPRRVAEGLERDVDGQRSARARRAPPARRARWRPRRACPRARRWCRPPRAASAARACAAAAATGSGRGRRARRAARGCRRRASPDRRSPRARSARPARCGRARRARPRAGRRSSARRPSASARPRRARSAIAGSRVASW